MAANEIAGIGAAPLDGYAVAPRPGAAEPPLDLSLGHIGTRDSDAATVVVEHVGPFRVQLDLKTGKISVQTDATAFASRKQRRAAEREFLKAAARASAQTRFDLEGL